MENKSSKRIMLDMKLLQEMGTDHDNIDLNNITCTVNGPKDTVYEICRGKYP